MSNLELRLRDVDGKINQFRRPSMRIEIDTEPYNKDCNISIAIEAQWAQPSRYIELTRDEALQLAAHLMAIADLSQVKAA
jgi:hypothetical protein